MSWVRASVRDRALDLVAAALGPGRGVEAAASSWPRRILVVRPDHLGDILFLTAALRRLRSRWPDAEITCLVGPWARPVLENNPDVDRIETYPFPWFDRRGRRASTESVLRALELARRLRRGRYHLSLNARPDFWWGGLALRLAAIPERWGYAGFPGAAFSNRRVAWLPGVHEVARNAALVDATTGTAGGALELTAFRPTPAARARALALLGGAGIRSASAERPLILLHPGAGAPAKLWTAEGWAAVVDAPRFRVTTVALVAGPSERTLAEAIRSRQAEPSPLIDDATSLDELGALFELATLGLGVDSGPMHLAAAVGRPTVRLYGPSDEVAFGPWGPPGRHRVVRAPDTAPDPAWINAVGASHPSMRAIVPGLVVEALAGALGAAG